MSKEVTNNNIYITEEKLLGILMKKEDKIVHVIDKINPEVFSIQEYSHIYRAIVDLYREDITPDEISVLNRVTLCGHDIQPELINRIYSKGVGVMTRKQVVEYCDAIISSSFRRKTLKLCSDFLENAKTLTSPEDIVNKFLGLGIDLSNKLKASNNTSKIHIEENKIMDNIDMRLENPNYITGIPFGFPKLDEWLDGACEGEIITLGGESGSCKTYFALQILINMAYYLVENNIDKSLLFISLEMTKEQLYNRLLGIVSGINSEYFKRPHKYFVDNKLPCTDANIKTFKDKIKEAVETLNSLPIVLDDSSELSANEILSIAMKTYLKGGLACTFVDYAGLVGNDKEKAWDDITETYRRFKHLTKTTKTPLIILNQYNNDVKENKKNGYKPNLYFLTGGKEPRNASHKIIHTWKPDLHEDFIVDNEHLAGKIFVVNDKNRDGIGLMPDAELAFNNGALVEHETAKFNFEGLDIKDSIDNAAKKE